MPGNVVIAGPFQGGIDTYNDPTSIQDNEMVVCDNFEVDMDGSLKSRPPFVDRGTSLPLGSSGNIRILGYYYQSSAGVNTALVVASDGLSSTYYFSGGTWHLITSSLSATGMIQFNGQLWLVAPTGTCGYWTPTGGWVGDTWCPNGESIAVFKSRMYVIAGASAAARTQVSSANTAVPDVTDVYYSAVLGESPWQAVTSGTNQSPGISTFKLNAGDGQANVALLNYQNTLYVFRTASIWTFSYASNPSSGIVNLLVPNIGLADAQAITAYENYIYFMYEGRAYTLFAGLATIFNPKVPFVTSSRTNIYQPFAVSAFNRRIIFSYYDTMYVFNLRSQNWTTWHSQGGIGKIVQFTGALTSDVPVAVAHSNVAVSSGSSRSATLFYLTDAFSEEAEAGGNYVCTMQTKTFDFGAPANYKRLFWWAVDATYRAGFSASIVPLVFSTQVTWGQLRTMGRTWSQMLNYTWGSPSTGGLQASTTTPLNIGASPLRKTTRLQKNERFKQAYFTVALTVDGTTTTSPARIFLLELFVLVKDRVSRTVT